MKNILYILCFAVLVTSCRQDSDNMSPGSQMSTKSNANARVPNYGCKNQFLTFSSPSAQATLYGQYYAWRQTETAHFEWRTRADQRPRSDWGYIWEGYRTAKLRLYGPSPDYPLVDSLVVPNSGSANLALKTSYPDGFYILTIQTLYQAGQAGCDQDAVEFKVQRILPR